MLIVEQGRTIQSQSNLIKILVPESRELLGQRGKALADRQKADAQAQARAGQPTSSGHSPSNPVAPHADKNVKPQTQFPPVPAADLLDQRRALHSI